MFNLVKKSLLSLESSDYLPIKIPEFQLTFNLSCSREEKLLQFNSELNLANVSEAHIVDTTHDNRTQTHI
jgi:hypothetical protein